MTLLDNSVVNNIFLARQSHWWNIKSSVLETDSISIIRMMWFSHHSNDGDEAGLWNIGFFNSPDAAVCLRRLHWVLSPRKLKDSSFVIRILEYLSMLLHSKMSIHEVCSSENYLGTFLWQRRLLRNSPHRSWGRNSIQTSANMCSQQRTLWGVAATTEHWKSHGKWSRQYEA